MDAGLGSITLLPHQVSAVQRLHAAIDEFHGALLCDEVGLGKTYVALAVARSFSRRLVVAPAALGPMWRVALAAACVDAELETFETLSRADMHQRKGGRASRAIYDLVVIDEAHHARNPRTNRYLALESLVRGARVLLLSATPIHNRRDDLVALLSLFLGSRAGGMTSAELALCVVRREQKQLRTPLSIPSVGAVVHHEVPDDPALVRLLMGLPAPLPVRDGGLAGILIGRGLIHQWASSEAALRGALTRRIARATALCSSLEAGTYPTARELETWIYGDGALQLGFAELLSAPVGGQGELLGTVRAHLSALESVRAALDPIAAIDAERALIISRIKEIDAGKIVAFAQYAETVSMLFRRLARGGRVAMLTSHGARVVGGSLTRAEAIARFAPAATGARHPAAADAVDLLITTDLLSEGVNLQDARAVIHVDVPWTAARMEQRVGRAARLGAMHSHVSVHLIRPPRSAAAIIDSESIVQRKWGIAKTAIGSGAEIQKESIPANAERLRAILEEWLPSGKDSEHHGQVDTDGSVTVASIAASEPGFVAAVSCGDPALLVVGVADRVSIELADQIRQCASASGIEIGTDSAGTERLIDAIHAWWIGHQASVAAGLAGSVALRRRQITNRIDASIETAPPHLRASRLRTAARARRIATTPQCAAVERELEELLESRLAPDEWLAAVADVDNGELRDQRHGRSTGDLKIHAILILAVTPRRSRTPLAPESP